MKRLDKKQFKIEFKIKVIEDYINSNLSQVEIGYKYSLLISKNKDNIDVSCSNVKNWYKLYRQGKLKLSNAISVSHRVPLKEQTIVTDTLTLVKYIKPTIYLIDNVEYIIKDK